MMRLSQDEGKRAARIADEAGFTLVELLVTMLIAIPLLGAGIYGIADAFKNNTQITSRAYSANQADVGIERLVLDLRQAVNGTCGTVSGVQVTQTTNGNGTGTTIAMCGPTGTPTSTTAVENGSTVTISSLGAASQPVTWYCNTATQSFVATSTITVGPESCVRTVNGTTSSTFKGIQSLSLTGLIATSSNRSPSAPAALASTLGTTYSYTLNSTPTGAGGLSWVYISASIVDLQQNTTVAPAGVTTSSSGSVSAFTVPNTVATPINTGTELRNYGS